jgi:hypothetical protein
LDSLGGDAFVVVLSALGGQVDEDEFAVSYRGVPLGVPVMTRDGEQFGVLEHVLEVPEVDVFEGIVVWVGHGGWMDRHVQHELAKGHRSAARHMGVISTSNHLRFVEADKIAAITVGYIRCDLDREEAGRLQPPQGTSPVYYATAIDEARTVNNRYGQMFGRGYWRREQ